MYETNTLHRTGSKESVKGGERRITEVFEVSNRELAKKSNNKRRGTNQAKKRSTVQNSKTTNRNSFKRRGVIKKNKTRNKRKKATRASNSNKHRGGSNGMKKNEAKKKDNGKPNKKPDGKNNSEGKGKHKHKKGANKKDKKKKKKKSSTAPTMMYYPNFDIMACVADGMPPPYFPSMYFHTSAHECCAIHFTGVVTECIMKSTAGMGDNGYIIAVHHTGGASSGGKSGKSGGKSGKSEAVEPWGGSSWMGPADLGWSGAMILQTEEPTYYPSYFPTSAPTTYMPTTYIPT